MPIGALVAVVLVFIVAFWAGWFLRYTWGGGVIRPSANVMRSDTKCMDELMRKCRQAAGLRPNESILLWIEERSREQRGIQDLRERLSKELAGQAAEVIAVAQRNGDAVTIAEVQKIQEEAKALLVG